MPFETIKLSQREKDQLVALKRTTGIMNWNILCRWAFCFSLAEQETPPRVTIPTDSNVEMTWKTFAGDQQAIYLALLKQRAKIDGYDENNPKELNECFKTHLNRGIGYMFARDPRDLETFLGFIASPFSA